MAFTERWWASLVLFLVLLPLPSPAVATEQRGPRRRHEDVKERDLELELGEAREFLRTEGGSLRVWSHDIEAFENTHVGVGELQLEEDGLLLPHYTDADKVAYVLEGSGWMGAALPAGGLGRTYVRRVNKGDVVALPRGMVIWWYNDCNKRHRVLCATDTTFATKPSHVQPFGLAGGRGSTILDGFKRETLARAWGIDEDTLSSLLESQSEKDVGIIKAQRKIRFEELERMSEGECERRRMEEEEYHRRRRHEDITHLNVHIRGKHAAAGFDYVEELKYDSGAQQPDVYVRNGGTMQFINRHKLPALESVGFSVCRGRLERNAIFAPNFVRNAHQVVFVIRGGGRIEVSTGDGKSAFSQEVGAGSVLAIPEFFPSTKMAGDEGMEWVTIATSEHPSLTFLAGANSAFRHIPRQVLESAWGIEEDVFDKLRRGRKHEEVIFPERRTEEREREDHRRERRSTRDDDNTEGGVIDAIEAWLESGKRVVEETVRPLMAM